MFRIYIIRYRKSKKSFKKHDLIEMKNSIKMGIGSNLVILYEQSLILRVKTILLA